MTLESSDTEFLSYIARTKHTLSNIIGTSAKNINLMHEKLLTRTKISSQDDQLHYRAGSEKMWRPQCNDYVQCMPY